VKQRTCKECKRKFTPNPNMFLPPTCEKMECRIAYANKHLNKKAKEKKQVARKELKQFNNSDINILKRLAQKLFNQFIRLRDKDLPCISCGTTNDIQYHASHYRPATNSRLRFDERNVHKSCATCNSIKSGNLSEYRIALIEKIGLQTVEELEATNEPYRYSIEELQEIITKYRQKIKEFS